MSNETSTNDIAALRAHLFGTLAALRDKDNPMDLDGARAVSQVAQTIINTAKVEVEFVKATGQTSTTNFMTAKQALPSGITGIKQHRISG